MKCPQCRCRLRCNETRTQADGSIVRKRTCESCGRIVGTLERINPEAWAGFGPGSNPNSHANLELARAASQQTYRKMRELGHQKRRSS